MEDTGREQEEDRRKESNILDRNRRSLYLLYGTTFFIFLNFYTAQTITPIYVLDVGGSEFYAGLQSTLFFLTAVILRFYFGPLADRKGNRLTLFIGAVAFMTAPLLFIISDKVWYILLVRAYQSIGLAAYFSSSSSLASALAPSGKLGKYIGFYRLVTMSALIIGPAIALRLIESFGYNLYHGLGIITGVIAVVLLYFVQEPRDMSRITDGQGLLPRYNMLDLLKDQKLRPIYLSIFIISVAYGFLLTFTAIYIERAFSDVNPGIFFTLFGLGSLAANLSAGTISDRLGRPIVVFPCILIMGIGIAVFYFLPYHSVIIYGGSIIGGFGYAGSIAVLISWVVDVVHPARRTTALALQDSSIDIGIAFGSFFYGAMIPLIGMSWSYGLSGIILILFALWKIIMTKSTMKG